jgi:hypothetical protein
MLSRLSSFSGPTSKIFKIIISNTIDDFNYLNFSSTDGLSLVSTNGISNNWIYITNTNTSEIGNVYRSNAIKYNRSFSVEWVFECSGGSGADGFCIQWTPTNNSNGSVGGGVGLISTAVNAITFLTFANNNVTWYKSNSSQGSQAQVIGFRQNVYYWFDYDHVSSTGKVYYSTSSTKPISPQHSYTSFTFDSSNYYIGFGAATGGSTDNHILKSFRLTFFITTNTILYLDAGLTASYPGTGTTWTDLSVQSNNATLSNVTYNSGNGGYLLFNGVNSVGVLTSSKYNVVYSGKTVFLSGYLTTHMSNNTYRAFQGSSAGSRNFNFYLYRDGSGNYQFHFSAGGVGTNSSNLTSFTPGTWFTAAVTQTTGGIATYYYNGTYVSTISHAFSQYNAGSTENIGSADNYWDGRLGVVAIYKTELTSSEILQNHNSVKSRYGI